MILQSLAPSVNVVDARHLTSVEAWQAMQWHAFVAGACVATGAILAALVAVETCRIMARRRAIRKAMRWQQC